MSGTGDASLAEFCIVACAEAWRGDGEILASPIGNIPMIAVRLAAMTFEPDLVYTDGDAALLGAPMPIGEPDAPKVIEGWMPFRNVFEVVWSGKRHVMMGATQVDRHGNQNISAIGDFARPTRQLLGSRGAPGNTVNNRTSYWVPKHSPRVFVEQVDVVSGVGPRRAKEAGPAASRFNDIHRIVTNLGVLDVGGPDDTVRLLSAHPGVSVEEVQEATGFTLALPEGGEVPTTREPSYAELVLIREMLDPKGLRDREVPPVAQEAAT
jgi:acyl CoA:acetate/3-ketoacid CoA transferase beta subunit